MNDKLNIFRILHSAFSIQNSEFNYEQFLMTIHRRNKWLIYLRYWTVFLLAVSLSITYFLKSIQLDTLPLWTMTFFIAAYNIFFHKLWDILPGMYIKYPRLNSLHFSLLQISTDYVCLLFFVYYTGGIETPLYSLFILHVIIGSLVLPRAVVTTLILLVLAVTATGAVMEAQGIIPHHNITGLTSNSLYRNFDFIEFHFVVYGIVLLSSNYFANSISKELYLRERSLMDAYNKIADAEKAKSRYVMSVVHDLKTPISAATTYLNLLLDGSLGKLKQEHIRPVERSKKRLGDAISTINDVLQISQIKIESGSEKIEEVNLYRVFDEIYSDMLIMFVSKGIDYSFESDIKDDIYIQSDAKLMKLALANLITNAYKYTEPGGKIEVDIHDKKDSVVISVADNGIGIPDKEKDKIFQDFYRTSISKQKGIEGSGLGMSVVLHYIKSMNGNILVESPSRLKDGDARPGTDFILTLSKKFNPYALDVQKLDMELSL